MADGNPQIAPEVGELDLSQSPNDDQIREALDRFIKRGPALPGQFAIADMASFDAAMYAVGRLMHERDHTRHALRELLNAVYRFEKGPTDRDILAFNLAVAVAEDLLANDVPTPEVPPHG